MKVHTDSRVRPKYVTPNFRSPQGQRRSDIVAVAVDSRALLDLIARHIGGSQQCLKSTCVSTAKLNEPDKAVTTSPKGDDE